MDPTAQRSPLHLLADAGHYGQVDEPTRVAALILSESYHATESG
jgi:hypothetical protein